MHGKAQKDLSRAETRELTGTGIASFGPSHAENSEMQGWTSSVQLPAGTSVKIGKSRAAATCFFALSARSVFLPSGVLDSDRRKVSLAQQQEQARERLP